MGPALSVATRRLGCRCRWLAGGEGQHSSVCQGHGRLWCPGNGLAAGIVRCHAAPRLGLLTRMHGLVCGLAIQRLAALRGDAPGRGVFVEVIAVNHSLSPMRDKHQ